MNQMVKIVTVAVVSVCSVVSAADWPAWRGPDHDGVSRETDFNPAKLASPQALWEKAVGLGFSAVSVTDGKLYTAGHADDTDTVYCLDAKTGKEIWTHSYSIGTGGGYKGPRATPVVADGKVYAQSWEGQALCLDVADGKKLWEADFTTFGAKDLTWHFAGSALIHKNMAIYNAGLHGLALDKDSGAKVWSSPGGKGNYATPYLFKIGERECLAIFSESALFAVDLQTGEALWNVPWSTKYDINAADPIVVGDQMFISSGYGHGAALLRFTEKQAEIVWQNTDMVNQFDSSVLLDGHLYGISGNTGQKKCALVCMDWNTGAVKWAQGIGGYGALAAVEDKLVYLTEKTGDLVAAKAAPDGYQELARSAGLMQGGVCWTAPVYANGVLYCRNSEGKLLAIAGQ